MRYPVVMWAGVPFSINPTYNFDWLNCPVVYLLVKSGWNGHRTILYIGESENGARRWHNHEKWQDALFLGMNEVHFHLLARTKWQRLQTERHLRHCFRPQLNEQLSPIRGGMAVMGSFLR